MFCFRSVVVWIPLLMAFVEGAALCRDGSSTDDILETLVAEYRSHGLPFPPDDAKLVMREQEDGTVNGVRESHFELAFLVAPGDRPGRAIHWFGCEPVTVEFQQADVDIQPSIEVVAKTRTADHYYRWSGFTTLPDLALAIQCKARGWNELAQALFERSRRQSELSQFHPRPRSDQQAVAVLAWNYWCNQFAKRKDDRSIVVKQLRRLLDERYGLDTSANRNIIADMDVTLVKRNVEPDSLEAAIDALTELDVEGQWYPSPRYPSHNYYADRTSNVRKLRDAGLDAVPTLLKHIHDYRLTRSMENSQYGNYCWHIRIADVMAGVLNGLYPEGFAYDFRMAEGRGLSLDEAHVVHWWTETQGIGALKYLLKNAVTPNSKVNEGILRALGHSYPDELVKLFEQQVETLEYADALFAALADSKASDEQKFRLFLAASKSEDSQKRDLALRQLLVMKHPDAVPLVISELDKLPRTPKVQDWKSEAKRFRNLLNRTDDYRAWDAFERTVKKVDVERRLEMIGNIADCSDDRLDRVIAVLSKLLDDREVRVLQPKPSITEEKDPKKAIERMRAEFISGTSAGSVFPRLAAGDFAALQIARRLGLGVREESTWTGDDWAKLQECVRAALATRDAERKAKKDSKP